MNTFFDSHSVDLVNLLKMLPAVFGSAGLLTYMTRRSKPVPDHEVLHLLAGANAAVILLVCMALIGLTLWLFFGSPPPDQDARWIEPQFGLALLSSVLPS
ncbi:MAG: hypothetical protein FWD08_02620 [Alphaproteobacteria bacterium]|nr:hypothetical protein [Alphaproteobacteria bacterium]MCL2452539.1 hypothetical protein [Alphaproteobacteria bacterium]